MTKRGYFNFIADFVDRAPQGEALVSGDMAVVFANAFGTETERARQTVNTYLKRLADRGYLTRVKKGIYGKNKTTAFGLLGPDKTAITIKGLTRDGADTIGYAAGATLLNQLGIATLLPGKYTVATNKYRNMIPDGAAVKAIRPIADVTAENARYLQIIEAVRSMGKYPVDTDNPDMMMGEAIKKMDIDTDSLIMYANKHANDKELRKIIELALGKAEENEVA
jgi:hypothetical protein